MRLSTLLPFVPLVSAAQFTIDDPVFRQLQAGPDVKFQEPIAQEKWDACANVTAASVQPGAKCAWMTKSIYMKPHHQQTASDLNKCVTARCLLAEKPDEDAKEAAVAVLKRASNDNIYQEWEDSCEDPCVGGGTAAVIEGLMTDYSRLTNIVFWIVMWVLCGWCYLFCYCCCWSCPRCRCLRKERGLAHWYTKIGVLGTGIFVCISTFIAGTIGVAQIGVMTGGINIMNCGVTTLMRNMVAGVPGNKEKKNAFPGLLNLMETLDTLRKALLPDSKFLRDLSSALDQTTGIEKATAVVEGALASIEASYNAVDRALLNKDADGVAGSGKNNVKDLIHDVYFSHSGVPSGAQNVLKKIVSASVNAETGQYDALHLSMVASPIAKAAEALRKGVVESAGAELKNTLGEIKKQFFADMGGMTEENRKQIEGMATMLESALNDSVYNSLGRGSAAEGGTNYINPDENPIDAGEGSELRQYISLALLLPFIMLVPSVMLGLLAVVSFQFANRDNEGRYAKNEDYVSKSGNLNADKKEIKYNNMPGVFACCGFCYAGAIMTLLVFIVFLMVLVGFFGATGCMYFIEDFGGQKFNTTMVKMTGSGADSMSANMIDTCLLGQNGGMLLKTVMAKGCPKMCKLRCPDGTNPNAVKDEDLYLAVCDDADKARPTKCGDSYKEFPAECTDAEKVDQSMDYTMREVMLGAIRAQFEVADQEIAQIKDSNDFKTLLDLMNVDRLGSIIGNPGFKENKFTIGLLSDERVKDETNAEGKSVKIVGGSFAQAAETGLACFDVKLPQAVVNELPDGSLKRSGDAIGIKTIVNSLYSGDQMWATEPARDSTNVVFMDQQLFNGNNNVATCGINIGKTCNDAKLRNDENGTPYASKDKQDLNDLDKCKQFMKDAGEDWGTISSTNDKYNELRTCLDTGSNCANKADNHEFFFGTNLEDANSKAAYQCNPCEAGLNMLRMKFALRNYMPAVKFYQEYPAGVTAGAAYVADGPDKETEIVVDKTQAILQFDNTEKTGITDSTNANSMREFNGCDMGNLGGGKPLYACVHEKSEAEKKVAGKTGNPFTVWARAKVLTWGDANGAPKHGKDEMIYKLGNDGFSWNAVLGAGSMTNIIEDLPANSGVLRNNTDTKMISYIGAQLKRSIFRYDDETIAMFPNIMGSAPKVAKKANNGTDCSTMWADDTACAAATPAPSLGDGVAAALQVGAKCVGDPCVAATDVDVCCAPPAVIAPGSGIRGLMEMNFLGVCEKDVLDRANCEFLADAWQSTLDGLCYMWIPAIYLVAGAYGYAAFAHFILICLCKFIWRFVRDNVEMKRARRKILIKKAEEAEKNGEALDLTEEEAHLLENGVEEEPMVAWLRKTLGYDDDPPAVKFRRAVKKMQMAAALGGGWKNVGAQMAAKDKAAQEDV